ncbi:MAG: hypothetical protein V4587_00230 [Acidobacteriota bacterium]
MTDKQAKFFYFPAWGKCADANEWRMERGRLVGARLAADGQHQCGVQSVRPLFDAIWDAAEAIALAEHRAVKPDDLRHGCHVVAIGRDRSSKEMVNKEVERVVSLFRLLTNPENVEAQMNWDSPERAEKKNLIQAIKKKAPDEYICHIARDRWNGQFEYPWWEDLPLPALRQLAMTLNNRNAKWEAGKVES